MWGVMVSVLVDTDALLAVTPAVGVGVAGVVGNLLVLVVFAA